MKQGNFFSGRVSPNGNPITHFAIVKIRTPGKGEGLPWCNVLTANVGVIVRRLIREKLPFRSWFASLKHRDTDASGSIRDIHKGQLRHIPPAIAGAFIAIPPALCCFTGYLIRIGIAKVWWGPYRTRIGEIIVINTDLRTIAVEVIVAVRINCALGWHLALPVCRITLLTRRTLYRRKDASRGLIAAVSCAQVLIFADQRSTGLAIAIWVTGFDSVADVVVVAIAIFGRIDTGISDFVAGL